MAQAEQIKPSRLRTSAELQVTPPKNPVTRRLMAAIDVHDFERNLALLRARAVGSVADYTPFMKMRAPLKRWNSIRKERRDALKTICQVLVMHLDFSPDSDYLFEVKCSRRQMAEEAGLALMYSAQESNERTHPKGRVDTSRLDRGLSELLHMGAIWVAAERKNPEVRKLEMQMGLRERGCIYQRLSRIFITPVFFQMFGFTKAEVLKMMTAKRRAERKQGKYNPYQPVTKQSVWEESFLARNVARVKSPRLRKRLEHLKKSYLESMREHESHARSPQQVATPTLREPQTLFEKYQALEVFIQSTQGGAALYLAHQAVKQQHPELEQGEEAYLKEFLALHQRPPKEQQH